MSTTGCEHCRDLLNGLAEDKLQASRVDATHPHCACEKISVGIGSPGPILSDEYIYRLVISPGDVDEITGKLLLSSLKDAAENGLSVFRECASDDDIEALVRERLMRKADRKPKIVQALTRVKVSDIHQMENARSGRLFCVYDETVPRKDASLQPVPTHGTILQRIPPPKTDNRKGLIKEDQLELLKSMQAQLIQLEDFRGGLIGGLNERSINGDFISD
ncbi:hypothetical protein [Phyllobacterium sp. SB3]|uniref:hypothetical protein n=1 Tax=Phyllobacterium sp. SB3 TaxID=3156073 RepID=UPI0032AFB9C5